MNENLNLCEILKGYEGETFYSRAFGTCQLIDVLEDGLEVEVHNLEANDLIVYYTHNGTLAIDGEPDLFPSKTLFDWNKWLEKQNKCTKTWDEFVNNSKDITLIAQVDTYSKSNCCTENNTPIEKSALALLKIHLLIEVGYGGNITNKEWDDNEWKFVYQCSKSEIDIISTYRVRNLIAFHTREQAIEFLKYPENVQLLKDYFMIE